MRSFRDELPVLLTTEAAGEGRNLQFCHVMVNVDLPWNPCRSSSGWAASDDLVRARQDYLGSRGRTDQLIAPTEP